MSHKPRVESSGEQPPLRRLRAQPWEVREWAYALRTEMTQTQAREKIREKLGIFLGTNSAYSSFCSSHQSDQKQMEAWGAVESKMDFAARILADKWPDATPEQRRGLVIASYAEVMAAEGNTEFLDVFLRRWQDEDKLKLSKDAVALDARRVQMLEAKLEQVRTAVTAAKQPGGLTPEALAEIEQAAKIL